MKRLNAFMLRYHFTPEEMRMVRTTYLFSKRVAWRMANNIKQKGGGN